MREQSCQQRVRERQGLQSPKNFNLKDTNKQNFFHVTKTLPTNFKKVENLLHIQSGYSPRVDHVVRDSTTCDSIERPGRRGPH